MTNKKKEKKTMDEFTVRQFFYMNKVMDKESLIQTLERTHKEERKTLGEWEDIMVFKNIIL